MRSEPALTEDDLAELFQTHRAGLAGAVRGILGGGIEPLEVLQDAFLRALRALRKDSPPDDPVAWIFVVTMNLAKDRRRALARRGQDARSLEEIDAMGQLPTSTEHGPGTRAQQSEAVLAARLAIQELSDGEKEVFLMRVSGDLSFEAAAQALGIPVGTAKTRMRSALRRLRHQLAAFAPEDLDGATGGAR